MGKLSALLMLALALLTHPARAQETEIDQAVHEARQDTSLLHRVYDAVLNALVYVPTGQPPPQAANDTVPSAPGIFFPLVYDCGGAPCIIAFDRPERLTAWGSPEMKYASVAASSLVQSIVEQSNGTLLSLNPGTGYAYLFQPDELALMLEGVRSQTAPLRVASGTEIFMGAPATEIPAPLLTALLSALATQADIREAYLSQITMAEGEAGLLLVLRLDEGAAERFVAVADSLRAAVQDVVPPGSVMSISAFSPRGINRNVGQTGRLIYRRAERE